MYNNQAFLHKVCFHRLAQTYLFYQFFTSSDWASVFLISPHLCPHGPLYFFCLVPSLPFGLLSVSWLKIKLLHSFVVGVFVERAVRKLGEEQNKRQLLLLPWLNFNPLYSVITIHTLTHKGTKQSMCLTMPPTINQQLHKQTSSRWQWSTAQHRPVKIQLSITLPEGPCLFFYSLVIVFVAYLVCSQHWQYCYNPPGRFMYVI